MEKKRHEVSADDLERHFKTAGAHLKKVPLLFLWNVDETRIGPPKKQRPPPVIVAKDTPPGTTSVAVVRDDAQLTRLTVISAFGGSVPLLTISKNKTIGKHFLAEDQLYERHDYVIRNAMKTFITEVLFIEWLKTMFLPRIENLRAKANYTGSVVLFLDGHSTHVTQRAVAFAGSERILIIRLVPHSSHLSRPLDLCTFGLCRILYKKEQRKQKLKGETFKIHGAFPAFYRATIIPMFQWSFSRARFRLNSNNHFTPRIINRTEVLARISVPEISRE
jgi:hypothetical protein